MTDEEDHRLIDEWIAAGKMKVIPFNVASDWEEKRKSIMDEKRRRAHQARFMKRRRVKT